MKMRYNRIMTLSLIVTCVQASNPTNQEEAEQIEPDPTFGELLTMESYSFWANREEFLYNVLSRHLGNLHKQMDLIVKFMKDYEDSSLKALQNAIEPLETPNDRGKLIGSSAVLSHLMTDRYVTVIDELRQLLKSKGYRDLQVQLEWALDLTEKEEELAKKYNFKWPGEEDLYLSHVSLLQMQEFYGSTPQQFSKGMTIESLFGGVFKASHCANLGKAALYHKYYYTAIEWLEFALELLSQDATDKSISEVLVKTMLDEAIQTHNEVKVANEVARNYHIFLNTYMNPTYAGQPAPERQSGRVELLTYRGTAYGNRTDWEMNKISLCSGFEFQPIEIRSQMKCYLERKRHPYFILNPVKTEQLSKYPYIIQMYDVLGNKTIEQHYKVRHTMKLSRLEGFKDIRGGTKRRSSAGGAMPHGEFTDRINKKSEILTGLLQDILNEELQVAEYTYGRYFTPHTDPIYEIGTDNADAQAGDRLATLLYYLQEPTFGGFTPFLEAGIVGRPVKNSALFWLNMYRNGTIREDITHASCPVIHGHKIVFNRWIRYSPNFRSFQCSLNQLD